MIKGQSVFNYIRMSTEFKQRRKHSNKDSQRHKILYIGPNAMTKNKLQNHIITHTCYIIYVCTRNLT